jgi:hypothetical protein
MPAYIKLFRLALAVANWALYRMEKKMAQVDFSAAQASLAAPSANDDKLIAAYQADVAQAQAGVDALKASIDAEGAKVAAALPKV